jgi:NTE family protein
LVLGGGGSAGHAWEIGVVAGLADAGVDVTLADLVVGTSAGSTAALHLMSGDPLELVAAIVDSPVPSGGGRSSVAPVIDHLERTNRIIAAADDAADMRRRMGAAALELEAGSDGAARTRWRAVVAARLPGQQWPGRPLLITAVDAHTGEPVVFDRHSGVDVVDAVAASTSSGAAYRIGDHAYIDGGYRRNENADLAAGYDRVLVLAPFGGRSRHPAAWRMQLAAQVEELRAGGSAVETIVPEPRIADLFGANAMDPSQRAPAARAGYDQGRTLGERLAGFWG